MFRAARYRTCSTDGDFRRQRRIPAYIKAQSRGFAVGGRLSIRARNEILQPFSFKGATFKAGCGGIDIFAGSFSWINAEQFTRTLRAIGQNAVGYAFNLGLEVVCPTCAAQLNKLQHFMNQINKMSTDSCTAAKALVNTAVATRWETMSLEECKSKTPPMETGGRVVKLRFRQRSGNQDEAESRIVGAAAGGRDGAQRAARRGGSGPAGFDRNRHERRRQEIGHVTLRNDQYGGSGRLPAR